MKGAIETMIGVVVLAFMALLGTAYITASLNTPVSYTHLLPKHPWKTKGLSSQ